jgi:alpha,alpha-trehalase
MNRMRTLYFLLIIGIISCQEEHAPAPPFENPHYPLPEDRFGFFHREVMLMDQVPGESLYNAIPNKDPQDIINLYRRAKNDQGFQLKDFLEEHFELGEVKEFEFDPDEYDDIDEYAVGVLEAMKRPADPPQKDGSAIIALPNPYIVNELSDSYIYYWHTYFTMLGLKTLGDIETMQHMVDNYAHLIDLIGYVPYSNRTYNTSRSQPPFFTMMVELLGETTGENLVGKYLPQIEREYQYWMRMSDVVDEENVDSLKAVKIGDQILNRYRDENIWPRPDQYVNDISMASNVDWRPNWEVFRDMRSASESGWNFTARWFDGRWRNTINNAHILPVELNSLIYHMEDVLAIGYEEEGNSSKSQQYRSAADTRKKAINTLFWDEERGIYDDYDYEKDTLREKPSMAMMYPLYFGLATQEQADSVIAFAKKEMVSKGGFTSSAIDTRQRWDYPEGWPHVQWIGVKALERYGYQEDANEIAEDWVELNERIFEDFNRFLEYYNVVSPGDIDLRDNYPIGYSATIGVYLALKEYLESS